MLIFVIFLSAFCCFGDAYKILVVFSLPGKSHSILGDSFVSTLIEAGHEVTLITPFPKAEVHPNVHQINISSLIKDYKVENMKNSCKAAMQLSGIYNRINLVILAIKHENTQNLMADQSQVFDAVIVDWLLTPLMAGFAAVYGCPLVWFNSIHPHAIELELIDERTNPAYTNSLTANILPPFDFVTRVTELAKQLLEIVLLDLYQIFMVKPVYPELFEPAMKARGRVLPDFDEVAYNGSLMFFNAQPSTGFSFRLPPNAKYIGGYHIDPKPEPLPKDLQMILDNSKDGAIYFSMGSNLKSRDIAKHTKEALIKMFGKLKQTVLWKFEETIENLPRNIHLIKWAPQQSILNHTNLRIFITHGGKLSTTEAIHYGVPIIGVPIFGDQFANMNIAVKKGYGIRADYGDDMPENLGNAVNKMLNDPSFTIKAKELSAIFHDLPVTPRQELVHWVEHVIRTKGAPHLRSPALLVPWYQKMYLDLAALVLLVLYATPKLYKLIFCRKNNVVNKTKKAN